MQGQPVLIASTALGLLVEEHSTSIIDLQNLHAIHERRLEMLNLCMLPPQEEALSMDWLADAQGEDA